MPLSEEAQALGRGIVAAAPADLAKALCAGIAEIVGAGVRIAPGAVTDGSTTTERFASVVATVSADEPAHAIVLADNAAAVIDAAPELDIPGLEAAYRRIAAAKRLAKRPAPKGGPPISTNTIGFIYAQRAAHPVEAFVAELERLNGEHPHEQWPDMIVIGGVGVINYAVQFPGEGPSADHLPPAPGAVKGAPPPMYIVMVIRPAPDHAFNKLAAYLIAHLAFFAPDAKTVNYLDLLEGMPGFAITQGGYQYNLAGELLAVPPAFRNDRYLAPPPLIIDGPDGKPWGAISRLPWADGAVLMLEGKLPLEGLMVFLDAQSRTTLMTMRRPNDIQLSYVLPLSPEQYRSFLVRFQTRSNMRVRKSDAKWVVKTLANEGASSPFMARLFLGLLKLRNIVYDTPPARDAFDKAFEQVTTALTATRDAAREFETLWRRHADRVASGACVRRAPHRLFIDDDVDRELRRLMDNFLNASVRALKTAFPRLAAELGAELGFWFQKEAAFNRGAEKLAAADPLLADYVRHARAGWSETLVLRRNSIEHEGWSLPRVEYKDDGVSVEAIEPFVDGHSASAFMRLMLDRLCCAIEEMTAHLLHRRMDAGIGLHEIELGDRLPEAPERFRITATPGGEPLWCLRYHEQAFEDV